MELDLMPSRRHPTSGIRQPPLGCRLSVVECRALPPLPKNPTMPRLPLLFLASLLLLAFSSRAAPPYTNHAGNVVSGTVVALDAHTATFSNATETVTFPLSIFPPSEQRRLAADYGTPILPAAIRRAIDGANRAIARSRQRAAKGLCTPEESAAFIARTQSALSSYLDAQLASGLLTPAERAALPP